MGYTGVIVGVYTTKGEITGVIVNGAYGKQGNCKGDSQYFREGYPGHSNWQCQLVRWGSLDVVPVKKNFSVTSRKMNCCCARDTPVMPIGSANWLVGVPWMLLYL